MTLFLTIALVVLTIFGSVFVHFETLRFLGRLTQGGRQLAFVAILGLVVAHIVEVAFFGTAFYVSTNVFMNGSFAGVHSMAVIDYYYYAAETYSSLGYGDIYPLGNVRLLASVTPLIGILLLGWSSAFLFSLINNQSSAH